MTEKLVESDSLTQILTIQPGEVIIGKIVGLDKTETFLVDYPNNPTHAPLAALSTVPLSRECIEREVALLFAEGNLKKPIIMGLIHNGLEIFPENQLVEKNIKVQLDGEEIVLSAAKEIVLQCGQASITLTRAGKILIRGAYVLSRSSGVNRIKGASVQIN
ncbi:MAG: DUF6484 domain-containing protein [Pseudomonadota bacterium]|nr:DUF6484 domain-containing protein [Pseudomonadota bacterium]